MQNRITMEKVMLFVLFFYSTNVIYAQHYVYQTTTFEDDWSFIEFEPPDSNIWQVGTPSKEFLDSAYSGPYALMTDTLNILYEQGKHSFILKLERPLWGNCLAYWGLTFYQKYSFDSLYSGGYVEISYDEGETWTNFVFDDYYTGSNAGSANMYSENDTLANGEPGISGNYTWGEYSTIIEKEFGSPPDTSAYSIWVKFTYLNLNSDNLHEGWLIDNLEFAAQVWSEEIDIPEINMGKSIILYPNPVIDFLSIENKNKKLKYLTLEIFNIDGRISIKKEGLCNLYHEINLEQLNRGIYLYRISDDFNFTETGKIIKN